MDEKDCEFYNNWCRFNPVIKEMANSIWKERVESGNAEDDNKFGDWIEAKKHMCSVCRALTELKMDVVIYLKRL